jgi:hypothetical protein
MKTQIAVLVAALSSSFCSFKKPSAVIKSDPKSGASQSQYCAVPKRTDYSSHLNDPAQLSLLSNIVSKLGLEARGKDLIGTSNQEQLKLWVLYAFAPLSMGCRNYDQGGIQKYGSESFSNFVSTALRLVDRSASLLIEPVKVNDLSFIGASNSQKEFVGMLNAINRSITGQSNARFRSAGEDVLHGIPLSAEEESQLKDIEKEGYLKVVTYAEPFKNASGDMVSGRFLLYPNGADVSRHIKELSATYERALSLETNAYRAEAGKIMRRCITIHPFHDGNGRSCTLLAAWILAQRSIPHAVVWAGEDVLLKEEEFVSRFVEGIRFHETLRQELASKNAKN